MKKAHHLLAILLFLTLCPDQLISQVKVGDNPTEISPSAQLQIDATDKGVLIPRVALNSAADGITIPSPEPGLIVYSSGGSLNDGFYVNYGSTTAPDWCTFLKKEENKFVLNETYDTVAVDPVNVNPTDLGLGVSGTINDVPLNLTLTVTIPPNSLAKVNLQYSTPIGIVFNSDLYGYVGARFLREGVEAPMGSRKATLPALESDARMFSLSGLFIEDITNATSTPITLTYSLDAYLEYRENTSNATVRFNMWSATGANFNWGRGVMTAQVFTKDL